MSLKQLFGKRVKQLRRLNKMTQEKLSEKAGIYIRQLARIEAGQSFATSETIESLSNALSVTYKELFDFDSVVVNSDKENMTLEDIKNTSRNYEKLNRILEKISKSDEKTEYMLLAAEALEKKSARERLKSLLLGMMLK